MDDNRIALDKACIGFINDVTKVVIDASDVGENNNENGLKSIESKDAIISDKEVIIDVNQDVTVTNSSSMKAITKMHENDENRSNLDNIDSSNKVLNNNNNNEISESYDEEISNKINLKNNISTKLIEDDLRNRKEIDTSPCQSRNTRRIDAASPIMQSNVVMVTASGCFYGQLCFNSKDLYFNSSDINEEQKSDIAIVNSDSLRIRRRRWAISNISAVYHRRYRLRETAIEIFFSRGKHRNFFIDFGNTIENKQEKNEFARKLMNISPHSSFKHLCTNFQLVSEHKGLQENWINGNISNFEYIMALNTISGRSYNDLCQYPIMPWIIAQYDQPTIDLTDPKTYRDLTKPVGALNEDRLNEYLERFKSFNENINNEIPPFMYGSHYSTMVGVVLHFLVRLQPFAALHKEMQNGHFDVPDRLFASIPNSFKHNSSQLSEVKEIIPEFFTTPDIFRNINNFDFGITQEGQRISDVELPPWAESPEEFVRRI